jgi:hypothetical protein
VVKIARPASLRLQGGTIGSVSGSSADVASLIAIRT